MSWNIYIYAEVKGRNETEWKPLVNKCVCDDFKHYDSDFYDDLYCIKASETSIDSLRKINQESSFGNSYEVRYCNIDMFRKHLSSIINTFITEMKSVYTALGLDCMCIDDEDYWYSEEDDEDEEDKDTKKSDNPWVKYMTFPVNKKMLVDLSTSFHEYTKAVQMVGLCDMLSSMCDHYDDEIRLLFIMM